MRQALIATVILYLVGFAASEITLGILNSQGTQELPGMNEAFVHYWLPYELYRFFAGFTLYFLIRDRLLAPVDPTRPTRNRLVSLAVLAGSAATLGVGIIPGIPTYLASPICTTGLVVFSCSLAIYPVPLLVNWVTRTIGKLSFSAYITHFAALDVIDRLFQTYDLMSSSRHWGVGASAFVLASLSLTLAASVLTFRWIETPGRLRGLWIIDRMSLVEARFEWNRALRLPG